MRALLAVAALALGAAPLAAQTAAPAAPAPVQTGYGAWFGSIPDTEGGDAGILLRGTTPGSPAQKAGLKEGDLIVWMDKGPVASLADMVQVLRARQPGDTIEVAFFRGEEKKTIKVILGSRPGS
jgi:S1-C subfamily serine protease